jgi:seryl-tRNA synthetase
MLDVFSFIEERGGNPEAIRESQRRRHASVEVVDEIIQMWNDCKEGEFYNATEFPRDGGVR